MNYSSEGSQSSLNTIRPRKVLTNNSNNSSLNRPKLTNQSSSSSSSSSKPQQKSTTIRAKVYSKDIINNNNNNINSNVIISKLPTTASSGLRTSTSPMNRSASSSVSSSSDLRPQPLRTINSYQAPTNPNSKSNSLVPHNNRSRVTSPSSQPNKTRRTLSQSTSGRNSSLGQSTNPPILHPLIHRQPKPPQNVSPSNPTTTNSNNHNNSVSSASSSSSSSFSSIATAAATTLSTTPSTSSSLSLSPSSPSASSSSSSSSYPSPQLNHNRPTNSLNPQNRVKSPSISIISPNGFGTPPPLLVVDSANDPQRDPSPSSSSPPTSTGTITSSVKNSKGRAGRSELSLGKIQYEPNSRALDSSYPLGSSSDLSSTCSTASMVNSPVTPTFDRDESQGGGAEKSNETIVGEVEPDLMESLQRHLESAKLEADEAKINRKILDLEISNASLLAINGALERTKVKQANEIRELKQRLKDPRIPSFKNSRTNSITSSSVHSNNSDDETRLDENQGNDMSGEYGVNGSNVKEEEDLSLETLKEKDEEFRVVFEGMRSLIERCEDALRNKSEFKDHQVKRVLNYVEVEESQKKKKNFVREHHFKLKNNRFNINDDEEEGEGDDYEVLDGEGDYILEGVEEEEEEDELENETDDQTFTINSKLMTNNGKSFSPSNGQNNPSKRLEYHQSNLRNGLMGSNNGPTTTKLNHNKHQSLSISGNSYNQSNRLIVKRNSVSGNFIGGGSGPATVGKHKSILISQIPFPMNNFN